MSKRRANVADMRATARIDPGAWSRSSWRPLVAIAMAQTLLVFNVTALKVSVDPIATSYEASPSTVKTAIVVYSLVVAALILLGARVDQIFGARRMFRAMLLLYAASMLVMAASTGSKGMMAAQVIAGTATGALLPALPVLILDNYHGAKQARALGWFAAVQAMSFVPAMLLAGSLASRQGWRITFGLLALLAVASYALSARLHQAERQSRVGIDIVGLLLVVAAVACIGAGFDNLTSWGALWAGPRAPFSVLGISPAPAAILCGAVLIQAFLIWSHRYRAAGGTPLVALDAFGTTGRRAALFSFFLAGLLVSAITFVIPLYIEVVQGRTTSYTALALVPFAVAGFGGAVLVVRLHRWMPTKRIARSGFLLAAVGTASLGLTIRNDWSDLAVVLSGMVVGAGDGALATLLARLLIGGTRREPAADAGPLCSSSDYLGAAVGASLASAVLIGALATSVHRELAENPIVPDTFKARLDMEGVSFISNDELYGRLANTSATPEQVAEAVRINTQARLAALRICFYVLAAIALVAFLPCRALPMGPTAN